MDIEGKSFKADGSELDYGVLENDLKELFAAVTTPVDSDSYVSIDKVSIEPGDSTSKSLTTIRLTNIIVDVEVQNALAASLEGLLGGKFYLISNGETWLHVSDDYQSRLDEAVRRIHNPLVA